MILVYILLWLVAVWWLTGSLRQVLRSGRVLVLSTFMWADRNDNPGFFWLGVVQIVGPLFMLLLIPLLLLGFFVIGLAVGVPHPISK